MFLNHKPSSNDFLRGSILNLCFFEIESYFVCSILSQRKKQIEMLHPLKFPLLEIHYQYSLNVRLTLISLLSLNHLKRKKKKKNKTSKRKCKKKVRKKFKFLIFNSIQFNSLQFKNILQYHSKFKFKKISNLGKKKKSHFQNVQKIRNLELFSLLITNHSI